MGWIWGFGRAVCGPRDLELPPEDDAEGVGIWILQEDLHLAQDSGSIVAEYSFHVVIGRADAGLSDIE